MEEEEEGGGGEEEEEDDDDDDDDDNNCALWFCFCKLVGLRIFWGGGGDLGAISIFSVV